MGKARSIQVGSRHFAKAGEATAFFREMLNRYKMGDRVTEADCLDLTALIERHDEKDEKVGCGIAHFAVQAAPEPFGGRCFWIIRTDGSRIDISYPHCLEKKPYD